MVEGNIACLCLGGGTYEKAGGEKTRLFLTHRQIIVGWSVRGGWARVGYWGEEERIETFRWKAWKKQRSEGQTNETESMRTKIILLGVGESSKSYESGNERQVSLNFEEFLL